MSYCHDYQINGFKIGVGNILYAQGILLDLNDEKIVNAILNEDKKLLTSLREATKIIDEVACIDRFRQFEHYFCQGHGWKKAFYYHSTNELIELKRKAEKILCGDLASEDVRQEARIFLNAMDGDYPEYIPTEQDIKNRKQNRYRDSRAKWLRLLVESTGYKCTKCDHDKDLRIKHLVSIMNGGETELSNLEFRCSKHMNSK